MSAARNLGRFTLAQDGNEAWHACPTAGRLPRAHQAHGFSRR